MKIVKIKDIGKVITGETPSTKKPEFFGNKYPFITPSDIPSYDTYYVYKTERGLSEKGYLNQKSKLLPPRTVCYVCIGSTVGKICLTKVPSFTNQQLNNIIVDKEKFVPEYVYYRLRYETPRIQSIAGGTGSGKAIYNKTAFEEHQLEVHDDYNLQKKIASVLSAYDDLIENNTRRIQILEEMAQRIYQEWFVNFRFPGHEKVRFVSSELGKIPEGWEVVKLEDIIENVKEKTEPGEHLKNREYVPIDCIPRKSFLLLESQDYTHAKSSLILFNRKDILFGNMRSYFHKVIIAPFDGVTRTTCFVLRPRNKNYLSYAYLTLFNEKTVSYSAQHSKGSTIPYAVWEGGLAEMKIIMPSRKIIDAFEKIISPILEISINTFFKLRNLRTARDLLLPKLILGEVDVSNWEVVGGR